MDRSELLSIPLCSLLVPGGSAAISDSFALVGDRVVGAGRPGDGDDPPAPATDVGDKALLRDRQARSGSDEEGPELARFSKRTCRVEAACSNRGDRLYGSYPGWAESKALWGNTPSSSLSDVSFFQGQRVLACQTYAAPGEPSPQVRGLDTPSPAQTQRITGGRGELWAGFDLGAFSGGAYIYVVTPRGIFLHDETLALEASFPISSSVHGISGLVPETHSRKGGGP